MKKKVLKNESRYINNATFEKGMDFMAKSFAKVFDKLEQHDKLFAKVFDKLEQHDKLFAKIFDKLERHDKAFEVMLEETQNYGKEARDHRMTMSGLNSSDITQEREIEGLKIRVEKLEQKIK